VQGKSHPQNTDNPKIHAASGSRSGMTAPTVRAAKCSLPDHGFNNIQTKATWSGVSVKLYCHIFYRQGI
jgi:hypothetical protein